MAKTARRTSADIRTHERLERRADTILSALENPFRLSAHQSRHLRAELRGIRRKQSRMAVPAVSV